MAITRTNSWLDVVLDAGRTFIEQKRDQMQTAIAQRRVYVETYQALAMLTDRDLGDLGIQRGRIKKLAREAAYGL